MLNKNNNQNIYSKTELKLSPGENIRDDTYELHLSISYK